MKNDVRPDLARRRQRSLLTAVLFVMLFLVGLAATFSYGKPWDENIDVGNVMTNIRGYAAVVGLEEQARALTEGFHEAKIVEYVDRDHGMASYYGFFPIYLFTGFRTTETVYAWHIYTWVIFFSGVVAVYLFLKELFTSPVIWFGGMASFYLSPRFFAEGHYNNKDIVLAVLLIWMLYFLVRTARYGKWRDGILYAFFSALVMNCRIAGIPMWGAGAFFLALYRLLKRKKEGWSAVVGGLLLSPVFWFVLTPAAWGNPIGLIQYSLEHSTHYGRWNRVIMFSGNLIRPAEYGVPRSYLAKWLLMTIPEHVLLLFGLSCAVCLFRLAKRIWVRLRHETVPPIPDRDYFAVLLMLLFWMPFAFLTYISPSLVLYNGWRHCYFLYAPFILLFSYALEPEEKERKSSRIRYRLLCGVMIIGVISSAVDMIHFHPYQQVYFNRVARSLYAMEDYEGDYWNISNVAVLRRFEEECWQGETLKVALMVDTGAAQTEDMLNSKKLQVVDESEADYYLFNVSALYDKSVLAGYEPVSTVDVDGYIISGVFRRRTTEEGAGNSVDVAGWLGVLGGAGGLAVPDPLPVFRPSGSGGSVTPEKAVGAGDAGRRSHPAGGVSDDAFPNLERGDSWTSQSV